MDIVTLALGVHGALIALNVGNNGKIQVLEKLSISPGENMVSTIKKIVNVGFAYLVNASTPFCIME